MRQIFFSCVLCIACIYGIAAQTGNVGINTTTPQAMLHVKDSSVLFTGPSGLLPATPGAPPMSGAGTRMMWYPDKAAFRAGRVTGTHWDMDSIGDYSVAFGINAKPRGTASFVGGGESNTASGNESFIGGGFNNHASGDHSFIGGGFNNKAMNSYSFVGGGFINTASGTYSFVGGGQSNSASGEASFVGGGEGNTASGSHSFSGAGQNLFSRSYAEAVFGLYNTDYTPVSETGFNDNDRLFVIGNGTSAQGRSNAVTVLKNGNVGIGTSSPLRRLQVSNGSSGAPAQSFAIAVFESINNTYLNILAMSDKESGILFGLPGNSSHGGIIYNNAGNPAGMLFRTNGNLTRMTIRESGKVGINTTSPQAMFHVQDSSVVFTGPPGVLPGTPGPPPVSGTGTRMMWYPEKAAFRAGRVTSTHWDIESVGSYSIAFGFNTRSSGSSSVVSGGSTNTASGGSSVVSGGSTNTASGFSSVVGGGVGNTASGDYSCVASGANNAATANSSSVIGGQMNTSSGVSSFIGGGFTNTASGARSFTGGGTGLFSRSYSEAVFGSYNTDYTPLSASGFNSNDRLFVIGNGTTSSNRSNAVTVLKNGRVGIGTELPDTHLELRQSSPVLRVAANNANTSRVQLYEITSGNPFGFQFEYDGSDDKFHLWSKGFSGNDAIRMTWLKDGNVGIGTQSPTHPLHMVSGARCTSAGTWTNASDARLKDNVTSIRYGLETVKTLRPVSYSMRTTGEQQIGFIAQEVASLIPEVVSGHEGDPDQGEVMGLSYGNLTAVLVKAMQEQQEIIQEQQEIISQQERRIVALESRMDEMITQRTRHSDSE